MLAYSHHELAVLLCFCHQESPRPVAREKMAHFMLSLYHSLMRSAQSGRTTASVRMSNRNKVLIVVFATLFTVYRGLAIEPHAKFLKALEDAEKGDAKAQYTVGFAYWCPSGAKEFDGVAQDHAEAARWVRKAAEQGFAWAQNALGMMYSSGEGVPRSDYEATRYYRMAAEQGDSSAQFNLGENYRSGKGVQQDKVQAYKWLSLAGHSMAVECREARESELAELAGTMNPQQLSLAERFVREFLARTNQTKGGEKHDQAGGEPPKASGSGFFISDDGALLTNFHVVDGASRIVVNTKRGSFPAKVVKLDSANDIAIIRVSGSAFKSLPMIPSRGAKLADSVFTIGFPNPEMQGTEPKFTDGKISSLNGAQDDARYFQISVPVQPGNSGGPLVSSAGSVVGIVTARLSDRAALEVSGALPQNVNYALKSSYVLLLLESIPELAGKLKAPQSAKERKLDEVVKEAQEAVAQVLVY